MSQVRRRVVLTPGDPTGIGPEIAARCLREQERWTSLDLVIAGDRQAVLEAWRRWGAPDQLVEWRGEGSPPPAPPSRHWLYDPYERELHPPLEVAPEVSAIRWGVERCLAGEAGALVTGPIAKDRLLERGFPFPGHTEYLAHLTGSPRPVMTFVSPALRVALVTTHIPLAQVPARCTAQAVVQTSQIFSAALSERYAIGKPRLALCGLNPHAGEGGHLGTEDRDQLEPAVRQARQLGLELSGPYPADSLFPRAVGGAFDGVIALYHDQGLIPVKLQGRGHAVHLTLGLPILRTSVDHGVARDIAWRGVADPSGLAAALEEARRILET